MPRKKYSWRSHISLTLSILVLFSWIFLDSINIVLGKMYSSVLGYIIIFGIPLSIFFAIISMVTKSEKK